MGPTICGTPRTTYLPPPSLSVHSHLLPRELSPSPNPSGSPSALLGVPSVWVPLGSSSRSFYLYLFLRHEVAHSLSSPPSPCRPPRERCVRLFFVSFRCRHEAVLAQLRLQWDRGRLPLEMPVRGPSVSRLFQFNVYRRTRSSVLRHVAIRVMAQGCGQYLQYGDPISRPTRQVMCSNCLQGISASPRLLSLSCLCRVFRDLSLAVYHSSLGVLLAKGPCFFVSYVECVYQLNSARDRWPCAKL